MSLRCIVFSSDEETAAILREILSGLGVEAEFCPNAVAAAERITNQAFQIVIIDWDQQPEAGVLLNTARERKAAERPLTLAMVSNDADTPQALQAGANSLLRKPLAANQARETLTTARDLLRSKQLPSGSSGAGKERTAATPTFAVVPDATAEATLRAGEFLQTPTLAPGGLFETESMVPSLTEPSAGQVAPLKDLEPTASAVTAKQEASPEAVARPSGTRGLEWYLKNRSAGQPAGSSAAAAAPAPVSPAVGSGGRSNPDLTGYDQPLTASPKEIASSSEASLPPLRPQSEIGVRPAKKVPEPFRRAESEKSRAFEPALSPGFSFAKRAILPAIVLATIAVVAAPQAPWHSRMQGMWRNGRQALHSWLNPQPVTPTQTPLAHESFTRPGDEYKLPAADPIPDATTDPSQIQVVPMVDPTVKKTNPQGTNEMDPSAVPAEASPASPESSAQPPSASPAISSGDTDPFRGPGEHAAATQPAVTVIETPSPSPTPAPTPGSPAAPRAILPTPAQPRVVTPDGSIPPSLKSQIAPANPMMVSNKPVDAAAPAIEPVQVSESAERALLVRSPAPVYPATAKGQQGTVVLQVLIGRDGSVQDAKFMQGSLVFARNAIDGVRQWQFKPYLLNNRPVSVQTQMTLKFRP